MIAHTKFDMSVVTLSFAGSITSHLKEGINTSFDCDYYLGVRKKIKNNNLLISHGKPISLEVLAISHSLMEASFA